MKDKFINKEIGDIEKRKKGEEYKYNFIDKVDNMGMTTFFVLAVLSAFSSTTAVIPFLSIVILLGLNKVSCKKELLERVKKFNQEKKHLEKVLEKTPKSSEDLNTRRKAKIEELTEELKSFRIFYNVLDIVSLSTLVILFTFAIMALVNPGLYDITSMIAVFILHSIIVGESLSIDEDIQNYDNRITNIENDLRVIEYDEADQKQKTISKNDDIQRSVTKTKESQKVKGKGNIKNNEKIIEEFIENLEEKVKEEKIQKIKRS